MSSEPTAMFPVTDPGRHAKGRLKMRTLALDISRIWEASATTSTTLCRDHGMEVDTEPIEMEIGSALAAIRTLDLEVIQRSQGHDNRAEGWRRYEATRNADVQGRAVRGLTLLRNADTHAAGVVEVSPEEVFGGTAGYRVFPFWKLYDELPEAVRASSGNEEAYREAVGGRLVIETLLDAFAFLNRCDPTLASRDPKTGELEFFPLKPYPGPVGYERRHPDQPGRAEIHLEVRRRAEAKSPAGIRRTIQYSFPSGDSTVYCGYTDNGSRGQWAFTESAVQVARDVRNGFPYIVATADGAHRRVSAGPDGRLFAGSTGLDALAFPASSVDPAPEVWEGWWKWASEDAFHYRDQRHLG
ncbi:hypothetical protein STRCI_008564 [Streptomyces cinnabarinus]|uniref:Uncharacterized protein n=1 Tax=Streptomyces cinnabarinus TaxID=67287 RepID=A0ABY7KQM8_9ACTN|nr:hypothetical protein [Streptomyces cinnabarinus]WAZ26895.1 hypothetical protein STRCI_008564 [Streptomyces cinnabarinus]